MRSVFNSGQLSLQHVGVSVCERFSMLLVYFALVNAVCDCNVLAMMLTFWVWAVRRLTAMQSMCCMCKPARACGYSHGKHGLYNCEFSMPITLHKLLRLIEAGQTWLIIQCLCCHRLVIHKFSCDTSLKSSSKAILVSAISHCASPFESGRDLKKHM